MPLRRPSRRSCGLRASRRRCAAGARGRRSWRRATSRRTTRTASVMPVSGIRRVTPPMIRNVWTPMMVASPAANSFENGRVASTAIRNALPTSSMNATTTPIVPRRPSSSPIAENTKSVAAFGIESGLPRPSPVPAMPAGAERVPRLDDLEAVALRVAATGRCHVSTRSLHVVRTRWYATYTPTDRDEQHERADEVPRRVRSPCRASRRTRRRTAATSRGPSRTP